MGLGDGVFTIIYVMMGAAAVVSGLNFEKKNGKNYKGNHYDKYIKLNRGVLILIGGIILVGTFLEQGLPSFKGIITFITFGCLVIVWITYSIQSKKISTDKK